MDTLNSSETKSPRVTFGRFVLIAAAAMLIAAAVAKWSSQEPTRIPVMNRLLDWRWVSLCEAALGSFVLLRIHARIGRIAMLTAFVLFTVASVVMVFEGSKSCGCFGRVQIDPLLIAVLDLGMIACIASSKVRSAFSRIRLCLWIMLIFALSTFLLYDARTTSLRLSNNLLTKGSLITLTESSLRGSGFLPFYMVNCDFPETEAALIVLSTPGCPKCIAVKEDVAKLQADVTGVRILFVEVPSTNRPLEGCHLSTDFIWYVEAPLVALFRSDRVQETWCRAPTIDDLYDAGVGIAKE